MASSCIILQPWLCRACMLEIATGALVKAALTVRAGACQLVLTAQLCCLPVLLRQPLHQSLLVEGQEDGAGEAAAEALDGDDEPVGLEAMLAQASGDTGHGASVS